MYARIGIIENEDGLLTTFIVNHAKPEETTRQAQDSLFAWASVYPNSKLRIAKISLKAKGAGWSEIN